jgi:hypothetical protein
MKRLLLCLSVLAVVALIAYQCGYHELAALAAFSIVGMAGADTQAIDGIYKDYYEDFVADQTNNRNPLSDLLKPETVEFAGPRSRLHRRRHPQHLPDVGR